MGETIRAAHDHDGRAGDPTGGRCRRECASPPRLPPGFCWLRARLATVLDDDTTSAIVTDTGLGNGQVLGVFAAPNFLNDVLSAGLDFRSTPVQDVMDASAPTCTSGDS